MKNNHKKIQSFKDLAIQTQSIHNSIIDRKQDIKKIREQEPKDKYHQHDEQIERNAEESDQKQIEKLKQRYEYYLKQEHIPEQNDNLQQYTFEKKIQKKEEQQENTFINVQKSNHQQQQQLNSINNQNEQNNVEQKQTYENANNDPDPDQGILKKQKSVIANEYLDQLYTEKIDLLQKEAFVEEQIEKEQVFQEIQKQQQRQLNLANNEGFRAITEETGNADEFVDFDEENESFEGQGKHQLNGIRETQQIHKISESEGNLQQLTNISQVKRHNAYKENFLDQYQDTGVQFSNKKYFNIYVKKSKFNQFQKEQKELDDSINQDVEVENRNYQNNNNNNKISDYGKQQYEVHDRLVVKIYSSINIENINQNQSLCKEINNLFSSFSQMQDQNSLSVYGLYSQEINQNQVDVYIIYQFDEEEFEKNRQIQIELKNLQREKRIEEIENQRLKESIMQLQNQAEQKIQFLESKVQDVSQKYEEVVEKSKNNSFQNKNGDRSPQQQQLQFNEEELEKKEFLEEQIKERDLSEKVQEYCEYFMTSYKIEDLLRLQYYELIHIIIDVFSELQVMLPECKQMCDTVLDYFSKRQHEKEIYKQYYGRFIKRAGWYYFRVQFYPKSEELLSQAVQIIKEAFGENHPEYSDALYCQATGMVCDRKRCADLAKIALDKSIQISGPDSQETSMRYFLLSQVQRKMKNYQEAIEGFNKCLAINKKLYGPNDVKVAAIESSIGQLYEDQNNLQESLIHYKEVYEIRKLSLGEDHGHTIWAKQQINKVQQQINNQSKKKKKGGCFC